PDFDRYGYRPPACGKTFAPRRQHWPACAAEPRRLPGSVQHEYATATYGSPLAGQAWACGGSLLRPPPYKWPLHQPLQLLEPSEHASAPAILNPELLPLLPVRPNRARGDIQNLEEHARRGRLLALLQGDQSERLQSRQRPGIQRPQPLRIMLHASQIEHL